MFSLYNCLIIGSMRCAGTLKDDQHCYLCGQNGHRQFECPNQALEVYKLPSAMQEKVEEQYQKDVSRMAGDGPGPGPLLFLSVLCPCPHQTYSFETMTIPMPMWCRHEFVLVLVGAQVLNYAAIRLGHKALERKFIKLQLVKNCCRS